MKDEQTKFEEQTAPLKNTDKAFVQVSKDGSPVMPEKDSDVKADEAQEKRESENR